MVNLGMGSELSYRVLPEVVGSMGFVLPYVAEQVFIVVALIGQPVQEIVISMSNVGYRGVHGRRK